MSGYNTFAGAMVKPRMPVDDDASSSSSSVAEIRVTNRLRQLRVDKGLTLQQVATQAQLSQGFLSRVENHKAGITIANLERLAGALSVPLATFFEEDDRTLPLTICRAGEGRQGHITGSRRFRYEMLAANKKGKMMEPLLVELGARARTPKLQSHPGEEFNYILSGACRLSYGKRTIDLREGDTAYYDATVPHGSVALNNEKCRLLCIVGSRDYVFHGDLSRLLNGDCQ